MRNLLVTIENDTPLEELSKYVILMLLHLPEIVEQEDGILVRQWETV